METMRSRSTSESLITDLRDEAQNENHTFGIMFDHDTLRTNK